MDKSGTNVELRKSMILQELMGLSEADRLDVLMDVCDASSGPKKVHVRKKSKGESEPEDKPNVTFIEILCSALIDNMKGVVKTDFLTDSISQLNSDDQKIGMFFF